jgi:cobalt-zinc-cadmium efflux system outer membrane protein
MSFNPILRSALAAAAAVLAFWPGNASAHPQNAAPDTLLIYTAEDLVGAIVRSNRSVASLRTGAMADRRKTTYAGAFPDPLVMLTAQPMPVYTARGKQVLGIRVEQGIPFPGKAGLLRQMADLEADMGVDGARLQAVESILEAQLALNEIRKLEEMEAIIEQYRGRLKEHEKLALQQYEVGDGGQQAVIKLQLEQARLDQSLLELERMVAGNTLTVERLVQAPIAIGLLRRSSDPGRLADTDSAPRSNTDERSDLQMLKRKWEWALARKELLAYNDRPDMGVSLNWIGIFESDMPASSDGRDALALGFSVRVPIGRAAQRARIQESELDILAAEEKLQSAQFAIEAMAREVEAKNELDRRSGRHIEDSLLPATHALLETSISAYATGKGSFIDLLDAERTRFQLEKERTEIQFRLQAGELMLDRISGRLNRLVSLEF